MFGKFDEKTMTISYTNDDDEENTVRAVFEVCHRCSGTGSHVNPNVDGDGLTSEDFEDEEFEEAYFSGRYDVTCSKCHGNRVVPVADESDPGFAEYAKADYEYGQYMRADAMTRRFECGY